MHSGHALHLSPHKQAVPGASVLATRPYGQGGPVGP